MNHSEPICFEDFFKDDRYILLKNYLYNYLLRKKAVEKNLHEEELDLILEIGSGISPVVTRTNRIIYTDVSHNALQILKRIQRKGRYVVANGTELPFKAKIFSHAVCSEVLEHIQDDLMAIREISRVMVPTGCFIATFPHRKFYFSNDDRFVKHFRRYEIYEIRDLFKKAGLRLIYFQKVLGPLEKIMMNLLVYGFSIFQKFNLDLTVMPSSSTFSIILTKFFKTGNLIFMGLAWLDAKIMPRSLSTVLLVKGKLDA